MTSYVTKSGRVLTDEDIEALADEAERGYDVSNLKCRRCGAGYSDALREHAMGFHD
jgi:hypothetical protein